MAVWYQRTPHQWKGTLIAYPLHHRLDMVLPVERRIKISGRLWEISNAQGLNILGYCRALANKTQFIHRLCKVRDTMLFETTFAGSAIIES